MVVCLLRSAVPNSMMLQPKTVTQKSRRCFWKQEPFCKGLLWPKLEFWECHYFNQVDPLYFLIPNILTWLLSGTARQHLACQLTVKWPSGWISFSNAMSAKFVNQSVDLTAFTEADPVEYSLLSLVHALWYFLYQMAAIQSSYQMLIFHVGKTLGIPMVIPVGYTRCQVCTVQGLCPLHEHALQVAATCTVGHFCFSRF